MKKPKSSTNKINEPTFETSCGNIFEDLGFPQDEAVNMLARADLMIKIRQIIKDRGWTQRQAAKELSVPQPRIAEIMKLRMDHYSIDMLLKYLDKLGQSVSFIIQAKGEVA